MGRGRGGGDNWGLVERPSPSGRGWRACAGRGEIPVLADNREDLADPPHPPLRGTFSPGRRGC